MRLDKFLAHQLQLSRSIVHKELKAGVVIINDNVIKSGAYTLTERDIVYYRGNRMTLKSTKRYFMLHKPSGYICSTQDEDYPSFLNLIDEPMVHKLHAAGRLDVNTTGLVLVTDDGQWSHRITSPKHHYEKAYLVTLSAPITHQMIKQFAVGVQLKGERKLTKPARLIAGDEYHARVLLQEGRYHQIRRMFVAVGNHVEKLHRVCIGALCLDIDKGKYRALTEQEVALFLSPN